MTNDRALRHAHAMTSNALSKLKYTVSNTKNIWKGDLVLPIADLMCAVEALEQLHDVYLVPTDPAEVVAELRKVVQEILLPFHPAPRGSFADGCAIGWGAAADLVAEKLGVR